MFNIEEGGKSGERFARERRTGLLFRKIRKKITLIHIPVLFLSVEPKIDVKSG